MQNAAEMAKQMVDPWDQFKAVTEGLRISFGTLLLPTINDLLTRLTSGLQVVMGWTQAFPNITRWVGYLTLGILALGAAVGLGSMIVGLAKIAWAGFLAIMIPVKAALLLLTSPIGLIITAIGTLIYFIGDWLGWWDKLGEIMANTEWGRVILDMLGKIGEAFQKFKSWLGLDDMNIDLSANKTTTVEPLEQISRKPDPGIAAAGLAKVGTGNQHHYGGVNIHTDSITPADWEARAALQAG